MWIPLSLLTALAVASQDTWVKKRFSHLAPAEMAAFPLLYSLPICALAGGLVPVPPLDGVFWSYFLLGIPLNGVAFVLYTRAIQLSPLSLTIPYLAFTPSFMIFTGWLFLDELPDIWGNLGIVTTCLGGYVLNLSPGAGFFLAPLRAFNREAGSRIMLLVAFIFSFTAAIGKEAILHSSPVFYTMSFFAAHNLCVCIFLLWTKRARWRTFQRFPVQGLIAGLLFFCHILCHGWAVSMVKAAYMISVKRLSVMFSIIYGGLVFREENLLLRFCGALLMMAGAVMITLLAE